MRGQGPANTKAAASANVQDSPAITALLEQSEFSCLQRIGGNFWDPVSAFALFFHSDCIPYAADTGDHGTVLNAFEETFFYRVEKGWAFRNGGKKITMDWSSAWYVYSFFGNTGLEVGLNSDGITNLQSAAYGQRF